VKPHLIAFTQGDPAGVGPEIIAAAWPSADLHDSILPVVLGHPAIMRRAVRLRGVEVEVVPIDDVSQARSTPAIMPCLTVVSEDAVEVRAAAVDARAGQAAYDALLSAAQLARTGRIDAMVTAPLNKAALWRAGHRYPGHTEVLAECCGVSDFAMMLYLPEGARGPGSRGLGVVHVTLHLALRDVFSLLTTDAISAKIRLAHAVMHQLNSSHPAIGVAALNPHAGEDGLFGDEERTLIRPAVDRVRSEGIDAQGPFPADTLLARACAGEFDAVVAMYHDQGHIPLKLLGMHQAVNVTLGLPIVRTSVAHGTAFDLAWRGLAETSGLLQAARVAKRLCRPA
jgi:4-hydroxythreonine-4-phosphate dehydrogenase